MEFGILPKRYDSLNQKYSFSPRANGAYISKKHDSGFSPQSFSHIIDRSLLIRKIAYERDLTGPFTEYQKNCLEMYHSANS